MPECVTRADGPDRPDPHPRLQDRPALTNKPTDHKLGKRPQPRATLDEDRTRSPRRYSFVKVEAEALFVEEGKIWTSAGVSTGIDMALAVVERDLGRQVAVNVARRLVVQACRPGRQSQFSALFRSAGRSLRTSNGMDFRKPVVRARS